MAAEKLTKERLVQILIIFSVLVTAFTWRTIVYQAQNNVENSCEIGEHCELNLKPLYTKLVIDKKNKNTIEIRIQPIDINRKSSIPALSIRSDNSNNQINLVETNKWEVTLNPNQQVSQWSVFSNKKEIYTFELQILD